MDVQAWNAKYPPGWPVIVTRVDRKRFPARTASPAQRVGEHDFIELKGHRGLWLLSWRWALPRRRAGGASP
jgi:hypothetical protein